jgi:sugar-specific transcriptional regulator TrmB
VDAGLVESEAGYGGRFSAVPAEQAFPSLILREKEKLSLREKVAEELARELKPVRKSLAAAPEGELIQVLRDPRVIAERFERLQLEVERQVEVFVKAPFFAPQGNEAEDTLLRRGVRARSLYERAILDSPDVKPFLEQWIAKGEEARVYNGELPHKLAIFDRQNILMPLITPGGQGRTLFIRHPQLATSLGMLFDFLWEQAEPLSPRNGQVKGPARSVNPRVSKSSRRRGV